MVSFKYREIETGEIVEAVQFNAVDAEQQLTRAYPHWFIKLLIRRVQYHAALGQYWLFDRYALHAKDRLTDGTYIVNLGSLDNDDIIGAMQPDCFEGRYERVLK